MRLARATLAFCFVTLLTTGLFAQARVTVVHGVPGLTVDVYVNGALTLEDFEPETITDALELPAGDYDVAITAADADIADAVITGSATLADGDYVSLVAHLAEDGTPTLSAVAIDVSVAENGSRLTVAHKAAAPAVDIDLYRFFREVGTIEGLTNPDSVDLDVRRGLYFAAISPAGEDSRIGRAIPIFLRKKTTTVVYAIGSLEGGSFKVLTQNIAQEEPAAATATVIHGIPGLVVDVFVNGELTLDNFEPGTVTDPLSLPPGDYDIAITASEGGDPADPILSLSATLEDGINVSLIAHLLADGTPNLAAFVNDTSALKFGRGRLVVRHAAAAPPVDILLKRGRHRTATLEDLENSGERSADVYAGRYNATVFPAGGDESVAGPVELFVFPNRVKIVYAVGSLEDETFGFLTQVPI